MKVVVKEVKSNADTRRFVDLPFLVYKGDANWIAPMRSSMFRALNQRRNPLHKEASIVHFLALNQQGQCVGRTAGVIHPPYVDKFAPRAFFGFFEAIDDADVARSLLATVEHWAADRGMKTLAGPYSYISSQDVGMLVHGFEQPPALLQPYNPPYYPKLLDTCGYKPAFEMHCFTADRKHHSHLVAQMVARGDAVLRSNHLNVRSADPAQYDKELELLRRLYNRSFAHHPESVALGREVFEYQADELRTIIDPALVRIIEQSGEPIGFVVLIPNLNEVLAHYHGRLTIGLVLRWRSLLKSIKSVVPLMVGVVPEFVGKGVGRLISAEIARSMASGRYDTLHTTWVHQDNGMSRGLFSRIAPFPSKQHVVFERAV
jgi:GNAT superfamily N-acetyltransferase